MEYNTDIENLYGDNAEKRNLLLKRGFQLGNQSIEDYFANYPYEWRLNTITKEQIVSENNLKLLENKLFAKDSIDYGFNLSASNYSFEIFKNMNLEFDVAPSELDPYIARFVTIINLIGIGTLMSCDGWHRAEEKTYVRHMRLWMTDRYSTVWFWLICEFVFGEKWSHKYPRDLYKWNNIWQPFPAKNRALFEEDRYSREDNYDCSMLELRIVREMEMDIYNRINSYAIHLENNKNELIRIRNKWISMLESAYSPNMENIDFLGFMRLRRHIMEYVKEDLEKIKWHGRN